MAAHNPALRATVLKGKGAAFAGISHQFPIVGSHYLNDANMQSLAVQAQALGFVRTLPAALPDTDAVREVLARMRAAGFGAVFRRHHRRDRLAEQILQLQGLDEVHGTSFPCCRGSEVRSADVSQLCSLP